MDLPTVTSTDLAQRRAQVAVLPVGSYEQHGDHLPLTTDTLVACAIASRLADTYALHPLPAITISCSQEHENFAGTVSITASTLIAIIHDIRDSLARQRIHSLAIVNGHGGNYVLANIVCQSNVDGPHLTLFPGKEEWTLARQDAGMTSNGHDDMHGGELETSILLHTHPELVKASYTSADHEAKDREHLLITGMSAYTSSGIIGYPSLATPAKGQAALDSLVGSFADHLKLIGG
ncbi:creatininase family protein [Nocardia sp. NPDC060259]|uniref:creatininase family protein n=1 Tax=Nocardia sp. NPDC060259 TaxID=3347088 RepID=UPI0036677AFD